MCGRAGSRLDREEEDERVRKDEVRRRERL
jgi:hypothetical protein